MIFTDYYGFARPSDKTASRMDCVRATQGFEPFEEKRARHARKGSEKSDQIRIGQLSVYWVDNTGAKFNRDRTARGQSAIPMSERAPMSLTIASENLTGIFVPDVDAFPCVGYGDYKGAAIIFVMRDYERTGGRLPSTATLEMFIARGYKASAPSVWQAFVNGAYDDEIAALRHTANPDVGGNV